MLKRLCFPAVLVILATSAHGATFIVAPAGNDTNPGTHERPLETLVAAREAARKTEGGPHRIIVMPGEYFLTETLELDARDNGLTIEAEESGTVTIHGGSLLSGWRRDGEHLWSADVPGVKQGERDFRALIVNGRMPPRARLPETGTFTHKSSFNVRNLTSTGGRWQRPPTEEERTTMLYDPKDIPETLDIQNAEVRVYHMWDESLVGVARNDTQRHVLTFSARTISPVGAFGVKKYVIFNTREGMTRPGRWYLDRTAGRVVYWPLPGENMTKAKVVVPALEGIIRVAGTRKAPVQKVTIRGLTLQGTTTPLKPAGWCAAAFEGALAMQWVRQSVVEGVEISNVGGVGIKSQHLEDCEIVGCHVHHTGACGVQVGGSRTRVARNHIHNIGIYYPGAVALHGITKLPEGTDGLHLFRNEIHDVTYSGIVCGRDNNLIEQNLIYRVMREMHDGAAIYCSRARNTVLRGNMVRDVVAVGKGFGVSAYYLDEQSENCVVERNVSIGVPRPTHNHLARKNVIRNNVFIVEGDMQLSFQRSADYTFEGNILYVPGKIRITGPGALKVWKDNIIFRNGIGEEGTPRPFTISDAMPPVTPPTRRLSPVSVTRIEQPPQLDGEIDLDEWPGKDYRVDQAASRLPASGPPVIARLCYDDKYLYISMLVVVREPGKLRKGTTWGQDDGVEVCIAGKTPDGKPTTFVLRGFAGGASRSVVVAGATEDAAKHLDKSTGFAAKVWKHGWNGEWAIPFESLGLKPQPNDKVPFNLAAFRSAHNEWRCWAGTLGENWHLAQAGVLQFK